MYNYSKLKGRIYQIYRTQGEFAEAMGMSRSQISHKILNESEWKLSEILKAVDLLYIPNSEIGMYFFTVWVQKHERKQDGYCKVVETCTIYYAYILEI